MKPDAPFACYLAKQIEIDHAWDLCERHLSALPEPLGALAARFLQSVADDQGHHRGYFSTPLAPPLLYLPLWLRDGLLGKRPELATIPLAPLLAGAMLGYFHVRFQDDLLDEPERGDPALQLLGNTCFVALVEACRATLGLHEAFWRAFDRAFLDMSRLTLAEQYAVRSDAPYTDALFEAHAGKVAFARIPVLAVAALAGRMDLAPALEALVGRLGVAYGLVNDVLGWPRDLRAGHRTYLLARAGLSQDDLARVARVEPPAERDAAREELATRLRERLYEGGLLRGALERAGEVHHEAREMSRTLDVLPGFDAFTDERITWLESLDSRLAAITLQRALARGRAP
ncbi:class 1 isoprenoid biosynthesis enzyme [Polyangium sorediatum]|uniref:Class 1 isoprenoid biosynthesis enzyme n=1 Tax=Polyangium sorediatum TaxID=889274 RepID=A0ABT6P2A0_9BACT|nr:class 1 isoprenoid biosynthesis enzyme [Polyangium sorediatum]MDI1434730.1 class 1 isoprenoid biosynthesis enzyme [Polyangium sorediatum]